MRNNLRVLRAKHDMTQESLANRAGISRVTVCRVESGNCLPDGHTILKLAGAFGCSPANIFPILSAKQRRANV